MLKKSLTLALACFVIFSCDDEREALPVQYLKVTVDILYSTGQTDDWLVLQDENGKLLSAKSFEANDVIIFDSVKVISSPLSVSVFRYDPAATFYSIESYLGIPVGEELTLKNSIPTFASAPSQGKLLVKVSDANIGDSFDAALSWKEYFEVPGGNSTPTTHVFHERDITSTFDDFFLFVSDKNGNPKYKFLENVTPGTLDFSLADLNNFDKTIKLDLPGTSENSGAFVQAFENDQIFSPGHGYRVNFYLKGVLGYPRSFYTLGYLNRFSRYFTTAWATYPGYQVFYESKGAAPTENIILTKGNVNISNNTLAGFTVTGSDFDWRATDFNYRSNAGGNINWTIYSDKQHLKNIALPAAFTSRFSNFNGNLMKHLRTRFNKGTTYENYVLKNLQGQELDSYTMTTTSIN